MESDFDSHVRFYLPSTKSRMFKKYRLHRCNLNAFNMLSLVLNVWNLKDR